MKESETIMRRSFAWKRDCASVEFVKHGVCSKSLSMRWLGNKSSTNFNFVIEGFDVTVGDPTADGHWFQMGAVEDIVTQGIWPPNGVCPSFCCHNPELGKAYIDGNEVPLKEAEEFFYAHEELWTNSNRDFYGRFFDLFKVEGDYDAFYDSKVISDD